MEMPLSLSQALKKTRVKLSKFLQENTVVSLRNCQVSQNRQRPSTILVAVLLRIQTILLVQYLRGQTYDGTGKMAGKSKGAAAVITSQYPLEHTSTVLAIV